jgi:hypothetical protein
VGYHCEPNGLWDEDSGEDPHHRTLDGCYLADKNLHQMLIIDGGGPHQSHE